MDLIFGLYDPENLIIDTSLCTWARIGKLVPLSGIFGRHLGFGALLWVGGVFKCDIRIPRVILHRNRHLTRRYPQNLKLSPWRRPSWTPS